MHAIDRPQLPRIGMLALSAALLAIVIVLLIASRLGDVGAGLGAGSPGVATYPPATFNSMRPADSSWLANPFASPFHVTLPWTAANRR